MDEMPLLELVGISKEFPGVRALDNVDFTLETGEVHGLVGENGAGKSTLTNVIGGVVLPDRGSIHLRGREVEIPSPAQARDLGIGFIHQELSLFPNLDVASNLFLGELPQGLPGMVDGKGMNAKARIILDRVGLSEVRPSQKLESLSPGMKQLVEIGRCLAQRNDLIVLDEPTSSLASRETETLFGIIRELKKGGVSIIYVSHRLDEVFEVCDRVTVLRDGKKIGTVATDQTTRSELVRMILGHEVGSDWIQEKRKVGPILLRADRIGRGRVLRDISFELHEGEVLGIGGLLGSGRTELARALFGLDPIDKGEIWVGGKRAQIHSPGDAIRQGMGFITENRREEGLLVEKSVMDNIVVANLGSFSNWFGWISIRREREAAEEQRTKLRIVTPSIDRLVMYLSGGNQQKVVLGKWLQTKPRVLILDEATRGIDVGAKEEVYRLIQEIAAQGAGIIYISCEIPELTRVSDRVLVMRRGAVVAALDRGKFSGQDILLAATAGDAS